MKTQWDRSSQKNWKQSEMIGLLAISVIISAVFCYRFFLETNGEINSFGLVLKILESLIYSGILILVIKKEVPSIDSKQFSLTLFLLLIAELCKLWFGSSVSYISILVPSALVLAQTLGSKSALVWIAVTSINWPISPNGSAEGRIIISCLLASIVALSAGKFRNNNKLIQVALFIPLSSYISQNLFLTNKNIYFDNSASEYFWDPSGQIASESISLGIIIIISILLIPFIERAFGLITKARLLELADFERPLLRRLSKEAPGTFEHTLMICGLAEEGARSIGANVDLIRTGALYHDIGKLHAPNWFIENQEGDLNPHDQLNNPFKSSQILQGHVDEGIKIAKKYRLSQEIIKFIPEHQGTLKMGYFFHQAKKINPTVSENKFRYAGPIPQSKETAILMLADGCEAALRALDPSSNDLDANKTIKNIFLSRICDGQLNNCNLSKTELFIIQNSFLNVWKRMRHRRIQYPISKTTN